MDAPGEGGRVCTAESERTQLDALKARYAGTWWIWEARGEYHARRRGDYWQHAGDSPYAVRALSVLGLRAKLKVAEAFPPRGAGGGEGSPARPPACVHNAAGRAGGAR